MTNVWLQICIIRVGIAFAQFGFQIRDKRVSRKHGLITVCPLGIKIKACHVNPIFYKLKPEFQTQILSQNSADIALGNSDRFSLLPNEFEFEVKIIDDNSVASNEISIASTMRRDANQNNSDPERTPSPNSLAAQLISEEMTSDQDSNNRVAIKRSSNEPTECDNNSKKIKTSSELSVNNPAALSNPALPSISPTEALPITALTIKPDPDAQTSPTTSSTPATSSNITIKPDPDANETPSTTSLPAISINIAVKPDSDASPAEPANTRESCQYGIRCYRQTVDHRDAMAHPLDLDYRRPHFPAPPADTPDCPFGAACYRRNVEHFQRLNHPPSSEFLLKSSPYRLFWFRLIKSQTNTCPNRLKLRQE